MSVSWLNDWCRAAVDLYKECAEVCSEKCTGQTCAAAEDPSNELGIFQGLCDGASPPEERDFVEIIRSPCIDRDMIWTWLFAQDRMMRSSKYRDSSDLFRDFDNFKRQGALMSMRDDMGDPNVAELNHLIDVASLAMYFAATAVAATERGTEDSNADVSVREAYTRLEDSVLSDGTVDPTEKALLQRIAAQFDGESWPQPPYAFPDQLEFLADGHRMPTDIGSKRFVKVDDGGDGATYLNRGLWWPEGDTPETPYPAGVVILDEHEPPAKGHDMRDTCYLFAVSGSKYWKESKYYPERPNDFNHVSFELELIDNYRPIDLEHEKAAPGDVVAYYNGTISHMAVVTAVDSDGIPLRAMSKPGSSHLVLEYPPDQTSLHYGFSFRIMRHKKEPGTPRT
jgi:hypothetical protein